MVRRHREEEQIAFLDLGKTSLELKFFDLSWIADWVQTIDLKYSDLESPSFHEHVITLSPDLSILQAGLHVFDLLHLANRVCLFLSLHSISCDMERTHAYLSAYAIVS